jgi:hypothetical protein
VYATGYSRRSLVFDEALAAVTRALSEADDQPTLEGVAIEPAARTALERAAPIYRKVWWPAHRASNEAFRASLQALVDRHGRAVLEFITRAYGEQWPTAGFPVHLSAYVDSRGAYSTYGNLLVVSATRDPSEQKTIPLEIVFHEAMHQWDESRGTIHGATRQLTSEPGAAATAFAVANDDVNVEGMARQSLHVSTLYTPDHSCRKSTPRSSHGSRARDEDAVCPNPQAATCDADFYTMQCSVTAVPGYGNYVLVAQFVDDCSKR